MTDRELFEHHFALASEGFKPVPAASVHATEDEPYLSAAVNLAWKIWRVARQNTLRDAASICAYMGKEKGFAFAADHLRDMGDKVKT